MKRFNMALAIAVFGLCARAGIETISIGHNESASVPVACRVVGIECATSVANGTFTPQRERLVMAEREVVTPHAFTNHTYSVVTTNGAATVTNVLSRPHPLPFPDTLKAYWTNEVVTAWSVTNLVPYVAAAVTNNVSTNIFLAPGDVVFTPATDTFRGRVILFVER